MDVGSLWADSALRRGIIQTAIMAIALIAARVALTRALRSFGPHRHDALQLRWAAYVRRTFWFALALGVVVIWATEIQTFALSIVAFAVAIVLATKELILCVSGSIVRTGGRSFSVGDRVEIDGVRGDVIDHGFLCTTILEIGPNHQRTGRQVVVPNSVFLNTAVVNETATDEYVLHTLTVPLSRESDWRASEQALLTAAYETCKDYIEPAGTHLDALSSQISLRRTSVEPRVSIVIASETTLHLLLRVPTLARDKGAVEQNILRRFLAAERGERSTAAVMNT
jgi:small-conductance mechanosensitive channel